MRRASRVAVIRARRSGSGTCTHFVERHGLLLIIAFGESVVSIGVGIGDLPLTPGLFCGAFLALALSVALWWMYFVRDEEGAEAAFRATPAPARWRLAMNAYYYYAFLPMLLGIAYLAAGIKKTLGHLAQHPQPGAALALAGGVALFLVGDVAFRTALRLRPVRFRAAGAAFALAGSAAGIHLPVYGELLLLVAVLAAMLAVEARSCAVARPEDEPMRSGRPEDEPVRSGRPGDEPM
ncbi:low temperature requirement protein A [Streptomyces sp. NPDC001817]|uniref:low temperature requirement protein A n=1 Tax=Streptomyces sp. NPDC001817 TaxID=3154398 RepID=UPI00331CB7CC